MGELSQQWQDQVDNLRAHAADFMAAWNRLSNLGGTAAVQNTPELKAEFQKLQRSGSLIRSTIENVTRSIDATVKYFRSLFGDEDSNTMGSLGAIPLIPIAVIAGAITAITKWVKDVYLFERKVTETEKLIQAGVSPANAHKIVGEQNGLTLTQVALYTGAGLLLLFALPMIGKRKR